MEYPLLEGALKICIVGPSGSGKTTLAAKLIANEESVFKRPHKTVIFCHEFLDPLFRQLAKDLGERGVTVRTNHGLPNEIIADYEASGGATEPTLIVIDDLILRLAKDPEQTEKLFVWGSSKLNLDVMILVQNLYHKSLRNISLQWYVVLVKKVTVLYCSR